MITKEELELNNLIKTLNKEFENIDNSLSNIYDSRTKKSIDKEHELEYIKIEKVYKEMFKLNKELKYIEISLRNSKQYKKLAKKENTIDDLFNLDLFK